MLPRITDEVWDGLSAGEDAYENPYGMLNQWIDQRGVKSPFLLGRVIVTKQRSEPNYPSPSTRARVSGWRIHVVEKAVHHLREIVNLSSCETWSSTRDTRWHSITNKLARLPWMKLQLTWVPDMIDSASWWDLLNLLQRVLDDLRRQKSFVLASWKARIRASLRKAGKEAAKWVKEEPSYLSTITIEGEPTSNPRLIAEAVAIAWRPAFVHSPGWSSQQITSSLPAGKGYPLPPVHWQELVEVCKAKIGGAAGADGITPEMLLRIPREAWEDLASYLSSVESGTGLG